MTHIRGSHLLTTAIALALAIQSVGTAWADEDMGTIKARLAELEKQNETMHLRLVDLENKENQNWLSEERSNQIRQIVKDVLADAKTRGETSNGFSTGYNNGFYLQSDNGNFKLVIGGVLQVRYEMALHHVDNSKFATKPLAQGNTENSSGFDIRRARLNFSGNAFSPNLFYRFEGDFYGTSTGGFTVTDAYVGYVFSNLFKIRAGAFKAPFEKAELEYDANLELERPEVGFPFDPQRSLGFSLFGDIIKDKLGYEINANDGAKSNTLRTVDSSSSVTTNPPGGTPAYNLDNRMAFYSRLQYAGAGTIQEFYDGGESDLRRDTREFIWMAGIAAGYESQNSSAAAFAQNTTTIVGLGSNDSPGFAKAYVLNGDLFRATLDWSAKYQGLSVNTATYFQQINANPYAGSATAGLPYNANKSSFFQSGSYAQVGYMIIPAKMEILGRVGYLLNEGDPNIGEFYTAGFNYFLYGNNAKVLFDVNYMPEASYTDASTLQILNTHEVVVRLQLQLKF